MKYHSMYKAELARQVPCSAPTMGSYLRKIEHLLPHYSRSQRLLTPDQVKVFCEYYCVELSP